MPDATPREFVVQGYLNDTCGADSRAVESVPGGPDVYQYDIHPNHWWVDTDRDGGVF